GSSASNVSAPAPHIQATRAIRRATIAGSAASASPRLVQPLRAVKADTSILCPARATDTLHMAPPRVPRPPASDRNRECVLQNPPAEPADGPLEKTPSLQRMPAGTYPARRTRRR